VGVPHRPRHPGGDGDDPRRNQQMVPRRGKEHELGLVHGPAQRQDVHHEGRHHRVHRRDCDAEHTLAIAAPPGGHAGNERCQGRQTDQHCHGPREVRADDRDAQGVHLSNPRQELPERDRSAHRRPVAKGSPRSYQPRHIEQNNDDLQPEPSQQAPPHVVPTRSRLAQKPDEEDYVLPGDQAEGEIVGVGGEGGRYDVCQRRPGRGSSGPLGERPALQQPQLRQHGQATQQGHKDVHPRFLRIVHLEGRQRCEQPGEKPFYRPEEAPAERPGHGHDAHTGQRGEAPHRELTATENASPGVQQVVVQRWMDVQGGTTSDGSQIATRKGHAGALVVPQALSIQAVEAECCGEDKQDGEPGPLTRVPTSFSHGGARVPRWCQLPTPRRAGTPPATRPPASRDARR